MRSAAIWFALKYIDLVFVLMEQVLRLQGQQAYIQSAVSYQLIAVDNKYSNFGSPDRSSCLGTNFH